MSTTTLLYPFYLHRGDDSKPPPIWDAKFGGQTKYAKMPGASGPKNQAGLFFFSDNKGMAEAYCDGLSFEQGRSAYWITHTVTEQNLVLLDLSHACSIFQAMTTLKDIGLDVLGGAFRTYDVHDDEETLPPRNFSIFKTVFEEAYQLTKKRTHSESDLEILMKAEEGIRLNGSVGHTVSMFGQRLTDFENGSAFKQLVVDSGLKIDGYRWREHNDPRGLTNCLFSASKLSAGVCEDYTPRELRGIV